MKSTSILKVMANNDSLYVPSVPVSIKMTCTFYFVFSIISVLKPKFPSGYLRPVDYFRMKLIR